MGKAAVRWLLAATAIVSWAWAARAPGGAGAAVPDPASYVNPFNGTRVSSPDFGTGGGAGNTFPGPVVPFGMIQWGPDTSPASANAGGGYAYGDNKIRGFSVQRLSGAGCPNGGDFPFMPTTTPVTGSPVKPFSTDFADGFVRPFSHADEAAEPGYYRVGLDPGTPHQVEAELSATTRTGIGRFVFPPTPSANVLVNATGSRTGDRQGSVTIDPAHREVSGAASTGGFCAEPDRHAIYFAAQFSRPFAAFGTWTRQALSPGSISASDQSLGPPFIQGGDGATAQTGAYLSFDTAHDPGVVVRVGISFVSVDNARHNLDVESGSRSLDSVRAGARHAWVGELSKIEVGGGAEADRRTFYTMLYHSLITPNTFSDVDGRYRGMDNGVHTAGGYTQYANFSGWDVYRSQLALLALIEPRRASDFVQSLLADQRQSGWLPKWSVANGQTEVMTGDPADSALASIWALGGRGFDVRAALAAATKGATEEGRSQNAGYVERPAGDAYQQLGYVPHERNANAVLEGLDAWRRVLPAPGSAQADLAWGSAGTTLEYATDDFAVARLAAAAGDPTSCQRFLQRSGNWRNAFDPSVGYVRPRWSTGQFVTPYDPNSDDTYSSQGFAEGDGAQYTWMVPQDPAGLFQALGGSQVAATRLDKFFTELNAGPSSAHAYLGDEPNSNAPWLYDWVGRPYRTQEVVRQAILSLFDSSAGGYPGNDDLGQMSAWYVFGALGLYPGIPGTDVLALGSPLFPEETIHLAGGDFSIRAPAAAPDAPFVQRLSLDGREWPRSWLRLDDVSHGGRLDFSLGKTADPSWASDPSASPPSFGPGDPGGCRA